GTLAGRNSMGGALKLYTKDPSGRRDAYVSVEYGSYNSVNLRAGTNFTLLPDALFARITGFYRSSEGYVTDYDYNCTHKGSLGSFTATGANCVIGHDGGVNIGGIRGALLYDQGNGLKVRLSGEYIRQRNEPNASTLLATAGNDGVGDNAPSQNGVPYSYSGTSAWAGSPFIAYSPYAGIAAGDSFTHSPYVNYANYCNSSGRSGTNSYAGYCLSRKNNIDSYTASLAIDYRVAEKLTLKSITALSGYKADYTDDGDKSPLFTDLTDTQFDNHYLSQEVRLSGTLRRLDFTVGGIYTDQATVQGGTVDFSTFAMQQNDRIPLTTGALFAHADWRVAGGLHLIGGLRWTHEEKNYIFRRATINGQPNSTVPALIGFDNYTPAAYSGSHTDYRLALQYAFIHDIMA
ncbi:MAG TPA: TonB-dependent receptor, partial [Novosphingobium sp.]|nr:TonB-dependent receptor [Novosphingobium sp.]